MRWLALAGMFGCLCFPSGLANVLMSILNMKNDTSRTHAQSQEDCKSPLIVAVHKHNADEIRRLISAGIDLNDGSCGETALIDLNDGSCGETALTESIALGLTPIAKQLLLAGANPSLSDSRAVSPLMYAGFYGNEELAALLLSRGAKVNDVDLDGYSALMVAAYHGSDGRIVALLLRAGANVNLRNKRGGTALTSAAFSGDEIAVQELVAAGADLSANNDESTALSLAKNREVGRKPSHDRIVSFLTHVIASQGH